MLILVIFFILLFFFFVVLVVYLLFSFSFNYNSKPSGIRAGRKLRTVHRDSQWANKAYKKKKLGTVWKSNPFQGASHAKGIVVERLGIESKQPNSAIRKCVRVQLIKNGKKITAFVPRDGCLNYVDENVCIIFKNLDQLFFLFFLDKDSYFFFFKR